ncbi:Cupredoxin [Glarea lozoyensis ATCC 20868]|uniref:Cupredoxin n=1 Tax=Glarea lozoyensis (strain ATCC 20868 / MF5171) TaxID=1116229 RepID=S3CNQ3_GLAL2|nr:Cupredoxin [Glarea lozoyensis ATCC 20868]EPE28147.1 Cupredoxin [Glarea lozoyensis ATCC 20868]
MYFHCVILVAAAFLHAAKAGIDPWVSPEYKPIFQVELPIPPDLPPSTSYTNTTTGKSIDFYEINIHAFESQTYPGLNTTTYVGYNGIAPGPTLRMTKGREAVVRFVNNYDRNSSIHLHGSYSRTPFDGWAEDVTEPGEYKDYYYPNAQPVRTLWYHDHALGITAVNAYFGQAGFYILEDQAVSDRLGLPTGKYDIPLMLAGKQFLASGKLKSPEDERVSLYGDVITVNAQPWPYLKVEPRKYKFRLLDASISRTFSLYLVEDSKPKVPLTFTVVGADAGYTDHPVPTTNLVIAMAERYEIVIDFDQYKGKNLTLMNSRDFQTNPDYPATDRVLRFVVGNDVTSTVNNGAIPSHLSDLNMPDPRSQVDQAFTFERKNGQWLINGIGFEDIANRVVAFPPQGKVQRWRLTNKSGGWSHPIHIHLIDFQVVSRVGSGRQGVTPYEAASLKDVVYLGTNEEVEVMANFAPWSGVYMFHCHNLVHEDHDMMAAFNVSKVDLTTFGYPDTINFIDPMAPLFRAKPITGPTDLGQIQNVLLPYFQNLDAYPDGLVIEQALKDYYKNGGPKTSKPVTSTTVPTTLATSTKSDDPPKTTSATTKIEDKPKTTTA